MLFYEFNCFINSIKTAKSFNFIKITFINIIKIVCIKCHKQLLQSKYHFNFIKKKFYKNGLI